MGLFDVFKKKDCEICGKEVGMFGYKKLEDGEICKDCVKKLSPWFEDRRHATVAQIQEQLAYRAENEGKLASFRVAQVIGDYYKMYVEEVNGIPTRFFVTEASDYMSENPDIIEFKDLMSCTTDVRTYVRELKRKDSNGNQVSYNPPRFETDYDFYINMHIANNPYFDDIRFKINGSTVTLETRAGSSVGFLGMTFNTASVNVSSQREQQRYQDYTGMCQQIEFIVQKSRQTAPAPTANAQDPIEALLAKIPTATKEEISPLIKELSDLVWNRPDAEELREKCMKAIDDRTRELYAPSSDGQSETPMPTPARPKFCPACGAETEGGKFCQYCGTKF